FSISLIVGGIMSKYQIVNKELFGQIHTTIRRVEDSALIPCDISNTDYQAYLAWVAEGNTAEEWTPES
ncbi:MAG: hypothetical protein EB166_09525, partial [Thaumarchaeota archaeon]|nr:hypothetical protein [Nitrososphaerota archaeon]